MVELCYSWLTSSSKQLVLEDTLQWHLNFLHLIIVSHKHTHTILTLLGAPSGMGWREVRRDNRVTKKGKRDVEKRERV